jgi:DNA-binding NarL/FixJ family response regulator
VENEGFGLDEFWGMRKTGQSSGEGEPPIAADDLAHSTDDNLKEWSDKVRSLGKLPESTSSLSIALRLANATTTSAKMLEMLSHSDVVSVVEAVAANRSASQDTLEWPLKHPSADVRIGLLDNPSLSYSIQRRLIFDDDSDVRYAMAENHNIVRQMLEVLAKDENPFVSARAQKTLDRLDRKSTKTAKTTTIFIGEDDDFVRTVLKLHLRQYQEYEVIGEGATGESIIEQVAKLKPDLVLMDIGLPDLSGIKATMYIKNIVPTAHVIMVTSHEEEEDIIGSFKAGAEGYYLKTSSNKDLAKAIKTVVNGQQWIDPGIASAVLRQCISSTEVASVHEPLPSMGSKVEDPVKILMELVKKLADTNRVGMAISVCNAAAYLAQKLHGDDSKQARGCLVLLGDLYYLKEDYRESETAYLVELMKEISHQSDLTDLDSIDRSVFFLAQLNEALNNQDQAELYYSWSLRLRERLDDPNPAAEARKRLEVVLARKGEMKEQTPKVRQEVGCDNLFR